MLNVKGDDMCATSDSQHWPFRWAGGTSGEGTRWCKVDSGTELFV